jgi:hypothetical protein
MTATGRGMVLSAEMVGFPFFYAVYVMIRGAISGDYPYPIIDAGKLGYPVALLNTAIIFSLLVILDLSFVGH